MYDMDDFFTCARNGDVEGMIDIGVDVDAVNDVSLKVFQCI